MKRYLLIGLVLLTGCVPDKQIVFADGSQTQLSHWDGRWLVVNYWAEWCGPCRHEIPEFNALHEQRVSHGVVVLGVNYDELKGDKLAEVSKRMKIEFPVLTVDPQIEYGYERAQTLPMTVIVDPQRKVHDILIGPQTQASILAAISS